MNYSIKYYQVLLRIRPAQLGHIVKQILQIKRKNIATTTGYIFFADPVSVFGFTLLSEGMYESQMTKLLELLLRPNDNFLDIGGNEGYFSVIASSLVQKGKVYCIEPQSRLQEIISENIKINKSNNINLYPVAISNQAGEVELFLRPSTNTGASSLFRHWKFGTFKETVPTITLDQFFEKNLIDRVRLMKVDCEGAEHLVFAGATKTLQKQIIEFIALEYHPMICGKDKCNEIHNQLYSSGYILTKVNDQCIYHLIGAETELKSLGNLSSKCNWDI
ncbi:FkbM family methyltransferase [Geminocystis sp. NIES-3709]|uniref:FkbM family methyltransferase n=1 Tax=Geminocystis sp. NIES-3709 TaxID=1617448 RepID=UPI0005FC6B82|nr:FkbM family methyltransferase [Geminocystis sp. NIES-3709]BAQ66453.1 methyltransferase [Geminocystis sp. NIES-3709]